MNRRGGGVAAALAGVLMSAGVCWAQATLLEQLDRETQALHAQAQESVVQVLLPPPRWLSALTEEQQHPARKWGRQLDPQVQQQLTERRVGAVVLPSTSPAQGQQEDVEDETGEEDAGGWRIQTTPDGREVLLESSLQQGDESLLVIRPQARGAGDGGMRLEQRSGGEATVNNIAIVLDEAGHLLVPVYLEREQLAEPVPVRLNSGGMTRARFVGSDRQTNLTVLKCDQAIGAPARLGGRERPAEGALVLLLSPTNDSARLAVWTGGGGEWGVVVAADGRIAGFARHNQFLASGLALPVARQLIELGRVERPQLGMLVHQVSPDDPLRQTGLGRRPAMRVQTVFPGTPAAAAGLRAEDIMLELGGEPVGDVASLAALLSMQGGAIEVKILRGGQEHVVRVELGEGK